MTRPFTTDLEDLVADAVRNLATDCQDAVGDGRQSGLRLDDRQGGLGSCPGSGSHCRALKNIHKLATYVMK